MMVMPSDSQKRISFTVEDPAFKIALTNYAASRGMQLSALARAALAEYVKRHKPPADSPLHDDLRSWLL